jgi:hypothetical protein
VKRICLPVAAALMLQVMTAFSNAQDSGVPDTFYVELYPGDGIPPGDPPYVARFPLYVTHDIVDPYLDSLAGFVIPLRFWRSNPDRYCSLSYWWNTTSIIDVQPDVQQNRSIFRHLPSMQDPQIRNRMLDINADYVSGWDFIFLDLGDQISNFFLSLVPTGSPDQRWWEGSRVLLATMTFRLQDSMTMCVDTAFLPPGGTLRWSNSLAQTYMPRHLLEICEAVSPFGPPPAAECPEDHQRRTAGQFTVSGFWAGSNTRTMDAVSAESEGQGLGAVWLDNVVGLGTPQVQADVVYEVVDHCGSGATITVKGFDDIGREAGCSFDVYFGNFAPDLAIQSTWRALAGHTMKLWVRAVDPDGDPAVTSWNGVWNETDPGRYPVNQPSYQVGNPGRLTWEITEFDTGSWISSFSATDVCGVADTQEVSIVVGIPFCGDCNGDSSVDISDALHLLNYLFKGGDAPEPLCRGDANCNGERDTGDIVLLLNFLFKNSFAPCFECCAR